MEGYQAFISTLLTIGIIMYAIGQWRGGRVKKNDDAISSANQTMDLLKKQADAIQKDLDGAKQHIRDNEIQIAKMEESIKHKDMLLDQYFKIITNRNPDLEQTLKDVRFFLESLNKKIGNGEINKFNG